MKTPEQKAQWKAHFCSSRVGMFVNSMLMPAGAATGGLLGPVCPPPPGTPGAPANPEDLKKPAASPEGAAARIKAEEAQAKAKVAALEYLGTVDCRYYPEAEAGLIAGLRAEKNECVRLAAAKALANGCCCSPKVVKALTIAVSCSTADGFPAEASELVRTYAYVALERCLRRCVEEEPELPPEPPPAVKKAMLETLAPIGETVSYSAHILLAAYFPTQAAETRDEVFAEARRVLSRGLKLSPRTVARLSGPKNVADAVFPPDSRPDLSLASLKSFAGSVQVPSLPAIPSFAAIRRHAPTFPTALLRDAPLPRRPAAEPQPEPVRHAVAALPPPALVVERDAVVAPPPVAPPKPAPARQPAAQPAAQPAPPVAQQAAPPEKPARTGRANILNIVQDGWRR